MSKNEVENIAKIAEAVALQSSEAYLRVPSRNNPSGALTAHDIDAIKARFYDIIQAADRLKMIADNIAARA